MTQPPYGDQGGQWPGGGSDWQAPSDQTQHSGQPAPGGPPGYDQPQSYDQPGYEQPQQYDQYGQQPGYSDQYSAPPGGYPDQFSAPPAGYSDPAAHGMMPPTAPKQTNPVPWIVGGVAGVLVLVIVIIAGVLLVRAAGDSPSAGGSNGGGSDGGGSTGKYTVANVTNACEVIDPSALEKWAKNQDEEPEHREYRSEYSSTLSCSARYKGDSEDYSSAFISLSATVSGKGSNPKDSYDSAEKSAKGQTGSGRESGDISGLGEDAFFASEERKTDYSSSVTYEMGVLDSNLTFRIHIMAFGGEGSDIDKDDVAKVAEEQARKVMDGLKA